MAAGSGGCRANSRSFEIEEFVAGEVISLFCTDMCNCTEPILAALGVVEGIDLTMMRLAVARNTRNRFVVLMCAITHNPHGNLKQDG